MNDVKSFFRQPAVIRIAQLALGFLMVYAALAKIGQLQGFSAQVHNFRMLPIAMENLVAMTLPWIELMAGITLIAGVYARAGARLLFLVLAIFTIGVIQAMARGLDFECGCFGTSDGTRVGFVKVLQNLGMLLLAWIGTRASTADR